MRNLTEIYSQIAADPATRCSRNSVIFTTAIDLEIKCGVGSTHQRKDIVLHHRGQFRQFPRIVIGTVVPREYALRRAAIQIAHLLFITSNVMSKTGRRSSPQTGKWETKEIGASQGRKNRSAVDPAPEKGMEQVDQAERRSCLAER